MQHATKKLKKNAVVKASLHKPMFYGLCSALKESTLPILTHMFRKTNWNSFFCGLQAYPVLYETWHIQEHKIKTEISDIWRLAQY